MTFLALDWDSSQSRHRLPASLRSTIAMHGRTCPAFPTNFRISASLLRGSTSACPTCRPFSPLKRQSADLYVLKVPLPCPSCVRHASAARVGAAIITSYSTECSRSWVDTHAAHCIDDRCCEPIGERGAPPKLMLRSPLPRAHQLRESWVAQLDEEHAIVYVPVGPGAAGVANMDGSGAAGDKLDRLACHNHRVGVQPHQDVILIGRCLGYRSPDAVEVHSTGRQSGLGRVCDHEGIIVRGGVCRVQRMRGLHLRPVEPIGCLIDECLARHESPVAILGQGSAGAASEGGNGAPQAGGYFVDRSHAHKQIERRGCKNTPCPMPEAA
eukprot:scaffold33817_cov78-Phaeocystis_antarctica.AAC.4